MMMVSEIWMESLKRLSKCTAAGILLCCSAGGYAEVNPNIGTEAQYQQLLAVYTQLKDLNDDLQATEPPAGEKGPEGAPGEVGDQGLEGVIGPAVSRGRQRLLFNALRAHEQNYELLKNATRATRERIKATEALLQRLSDDADELVDPEGSGSD